MDAKRHHGETSGLHRDAPPPSYEVAAKHSPMVRAHRAGSELSHSQSWQSTPVSAAGGAFPPLIGTDGLPPPSHTSHPLRDDDIDPSSRHRAGSHAQKQKASPSRVANSRRAVRDDVSISDISDHHMDNDDWVSMSMHSGVPMGEDVENLNSDHYTRLVRFYQQYNPEKIERAFEFLKAYKGDEEELFKLLTEKYGPEPDYPKARPDADAKGSDAGSMFHFVGPRVRMPERVSPDDGRTEMFTPYWPSFRTLGDRDILDLLITKRTENKELKKCFVGYLEGHPHQAWNGMTYLSSAPLPRDPQTPFLGHNWSGTLANNKTLLYRTSTFRRIVLHCTDECQTRELPRAKLKQQPPTQPVPHTDANKGTTDDGSPMSSVGSSVGGFTPQPSSHSRQPSIDHSSQAAAPPTRPEYVIAPTPQKQEPCHQRHGRWRLAIYHCEELPYVLYRVMYDPDLVSMAWDGGDGVQQQVSAGSAMPTNGSFDVPSNKGDPKPTDAPAAEKRSFFSNLFSKKKKEDTPSGSEDRIAASAPQRTHPSSGAGRSMSTTRRDDDQYSISTGSSIPPRNKSPNRPYSRSGVRVMGYSEPQQPVRQPSSPVAPPISPDATLTQVVRLLQGLEARIGGRLDSIEARLSHLERHLPENIQ